MATITAVKSFTVQTLGRHQTSGVAWHVYNNDGLVLPGSSVVYTQPAAWESLNKYGRLS
jgi:hypothetical protein